MWQPIKIRIKDFMSFTNEEMSFLLNTPIIIQGENLTDDGQESNGSGKSALQEAFYRSITGTSIRKGIRDKDLIRNFCDETVIESWLTNTLTKEELYIKRTIHIKKSEILYIEVNNEDQKDKFATVKDGNRILMEEILCIPKEDIDNCYILNREKYVSFFFTSDTKKKDLIGRFSNANLIQGVDKFVEDDISVLEKELDVFDDKIISINGKIDYLNEELTEFDIETLKEERNKEIDALNEKIGDLKLTVIHDKKYLEALGKEVKKLDDSKHEDELKKVQEYLSDASDLKIDLNKEIEKSEELIDEYKDLISELRNKIRGQVTCPQCEYIFVAGDPGVNIKKVEKSIEDKEGDTEEIQGKLDKSQENIGEAKDIFKVLTTKEEKIRGKIKIIKDEKTTIEKEIAKYEISTSSDDEKLKKFNNEFKELGEEIEDETSTIKEKISNFEKDIIKVEKLKKKKEDEIFGVKQWIFNFKSFFSHLTNKSLKLIEFKTNEQLESMKSDLRIRIEGVKVLASGELRENITPEIIRDGFVTGAFGKLSGGERVRVEAGNIIARQSIINQASKKGGLDLIWIDEIFDQSDAKGIDLLMGALGLLSKTIIITTHIQSNFNHKTIKVVKENDESKIIV